MAYYIDFLDQQLPVFKTRTALIILGLQNDFLSPTGKLPIRTDSGFVQRIKDLVPTFREYGDVVWLRSEYQGDRPVNDLGSPGCTVILGEDVQDEAPLSSTHDQDVITADWEMLAPSQNHHSPEPTPDLDHFADGMEHNAIADTNPPATDPSQLDIDEELFLTDTPTKPACCIPGSVGKEYHPDVVDVIDPRKDIQIIKSHYSAFNSTSLLLTLRAKLVTKVYLSGCFTNMSVYATAMDAARYGMEINLLTDCLGYRKQGRHDEAMEQMADQMGALSTTAFSLMSRLRGEFEAEAPRLELQEEETRHDDSPTSLLRPASPTNSEHRYLNDLVLSDDGAATAVEGSEGAAPAQAARPTDADGQRVGSTHLDEGEAETSDSRPALDDGMEVGKQSPLSSTTMTLAEHETNAAPSRAETQLENALTENQPIPSANQDVPAVAIIPAAGNVANLQNRDDVLQDGRDPKATSQEESTAEQALSNPHVNPPSSKRSRLPESLATFTRLNPGDKVGNGESSIIFDFLPSSLSDLIFQRLFTEVHWQRMYHAQGEVPRLVCTQGDVDSTDGSTPVYRHPADCQLPLLRWSPSVLKAKREAEKRIGHKLNHVLVQLYRTGQDYISEHTDKTLDIVPDSKIVNVSFGAERTMRLRTKRKAPSSDSSSPRAKRQHREGDEGDAHSVVATSASADRADSRTTQRISMPHNSMFVMGLSTNSTWLHGISADKRLPANRSAAELAFNGMRISLTFRRIGTFLTSDSRRIWGQGAASKAKADAAPTVNGDERQSARLLKAFATENQSTAFDWQATYGRGSDVLHLRTPLPDTEAPVLFLSGCAVHDLSVRLYLAHLGLHATETAASTGSMRDLDACKDVRGQHLDTPGYVRRRICFRDTDALHTQVEGTMAVLLYLREHYARRVDRDASNTAPTTTTTTTTTLPAFELEVLAGRPLARLFEFADMLPTQETRDASAFLEHEELRELDAYIEDLDDQLLERSRVAGEECWVAGNDFGVVDCVLWPVVEKLGRTREKPALESWMRRVRQREDVKAILGEEEML